MEDLMREGYQDYVGPGKEEIEEWSEFRYKKWGKY
jgi:hypothetical protein